GKHVIIVEGAVGDHRAKGRDVLAPMKVPVIIDANSKSTRRSFPWRSLPKEVNTRAFDCVVRRGRRLANRKGNPPRGRCAARQTVPWARNRARTRSAGAGQTRLRARERLRRPICGQGADTSGDAARSSQNRNEWQCNDLILLILVAATGLEPALQFPRSRF